MNPRVSLRRVLPHPPSRVFRAFSGGAAVQSWLSPSPDVRAEVTQFEFEVGGAYGITYHVPDTSTLRLRGVFLAIVPERRIEMSWCWLPPDVHADLETHVRFEFLDLDGATELHLEHDRILGLDYAKRHTNGWLGALERLALLLATTETQKDPIS